MLIAFLASAWISFIFAAAAYWFGLLPAELLRDCDTLFVKRHARGSSRWYRTLRKAVLVFSDQQIVTGIAILVAGFIEWRDITVYHWQVVTYLGWMASNVHLTSLTFLRDYLQANETLRLWRIAGMTILFGLLVVSIVPSGSVAWAVAIANPSYSDGYGNAYTCDSMQLPAHCFWNMDLASLSSGLSELQYEGSIDGWTGVSPDTVGSYIILVLSYAWKAAMLFEPGKRLLRQGLRTSPLRVFERPLHRIAASYSSRSRSATESRRYQALMSLYIPLLAISNLAESFLASLWMVALGLGWGTVQLWSPRSSLPPNIRHEENSWGFGQLLPMFLLILPLLAVLEHFGNYQCINGNRNDA